jgi:hypothetical protein
MCSNNFAGNGMDNLQIYAWEYAWEIRKIHQNPWKNPWLPQIPVSADTRIRNLYPQIYPYGYGYKRIWIQTDMDTNGYGYKRIWIQTDMDISVSLPLPRGKTPPDEPDEDSGSRRHTRGRDESRKEPLRGSMPPEGKSSLRCSVSTNLACLSIADILGNVRRCWEVEASTHMPLHLEQCHECNRFVQHVADCSKGGLDQLIKVQRDHWIKELEDESQNVYDDGYDRAMEESRACEVELREMIKDLCRTILNQEQEITCSTPIEARQGETPPLLISP